MIPARLVLATANPGKVREFRTLLAQWGEIEVLDLAARPSLRMPEETGGSYRANALLKARAVVQATGVPSLADDSGLEVEALGGRPGVASARWAATDEARITRLLEALEGQPVERRRARFVAVVVLAWPDGRVESGEGICEGHIALRPEGGGGFGYDPVFVADDLGRTLASVAPADKARISHRARALHALRARLQRGSSLRPPGGDVR